MAVTNMKASLARIIPSVLLFVVIDQVVWASSFLLTKSLYLDVSYYTTWNPEAISLITGTTLATSSYVGVLLWTILLSLPFVVWYRAMKNQIPTGSAVKKGLIYGLMLYTTGAFFMLMGASYMVYVPPMVILAWAITALIEFLLQGVMLALINK